MLTMSSSQLVECAPSYDLKYDESNDALRDQTLQELKIAYGRDTKIKCCCYPGNTREYKVDAGFIAHMKSQKHRNWKEAQQKDHKQNYGHCISSEKIIETLRKEIRDYKKQHVQTIETINNKNEKLVLMSKKLDDMSVEADILKDELEEYQQENEDLKPETPALKTENEDLKTENEAFKKENEELKYNVDIVCEGFKAELEEYQNDIIAVTKEKDRITYDYNKLILATKKKAPGKIGERQAFR